LILYETLTDRNTQIDTDRQIHGDRHIHTYRQTDRDTDRQAGYEHELQNPDHQTYIQTDTHRYIQTD